MIVVAVSDNHGQNLAVPFRLEVINHAALATEFASPIIMNNAPRAQAADDNDVLMALRPALNWMYEIDLYNSKFDWSPVEDLFTFQITDEGIAEVWIMQGDWRRVMEGEAISSAHSIHIFGLRAGQTMLSIIHARTGQVVNVPVIVYSLQNQLYMFRVLPGQPVTLSFTNGAGQTRQISTAEHGFRGLIDEIAIWEESGIASDVFLESEHGLDRWVGTIPRDELISGEAPMSTYPVNVIELTLLSNITLIANRVGGGHYVGEVQVRGGLFRNGVYVPASEINKQLNVTAQDRGRVSIQLDTATFGEISIQDDFHYIFEVQFPNSNFAPMLIEIDAFYDARQALSSGILHMFLRPWDNRQEPLVVYMLNGRDVTNMNGSIGIPGGDRVNNLTMRIILPTGRLFESAEIREYGGGRQRPVGVQDARLFNPPFLGASYFQYVELTWIVSRDTLGNFIPMGESRQFNIEISYADGSSTIRMPFNVADLAGAAARELVIPVDWRLNTASLAPYRNVDGRSGPSVRVDASELEFYVQVTPTDNPAEYRFRAVIGEPQITSFDRRFNSIRNQLAIGLHIGADLTGSGIRDFAQLLSESERKQPRKRNLGKPKPSVNFDASHMALLAFVDGKLRWNPSTQQYDLIIEEGRMQGGSSISLGISVKIRLWTPPTITTKLGFESGFTNYVSMRISDNNNYIQITEFTGLYDKVSLGLEISIIIANAGVKGYGKHAFGFESATIHYTHYPRSSIMGRRRTSTVSFGAEWWAQALFVINAGGSIGTPIKLPISTRPISGNQYAFRDATAAIAQLETIDMVHFNDDFLIPTNVYLARGVPLSALPQIPWEVGAIAGDGTFAIAALETINERATEWLDELVNENEYVYMDDIINVMNQTEIAVVIARDGNWDEKNIHILTDNFRPDVAPHVAVFDNNAVVVWQRQQLENIGGEVTTMTEIWYAVYTGGQPNPWSEHARLDILGAYSLTGMDVAKTATGFSVIITTSDNQYNYEIVTVDVYDATGAVRQELMRLYSATGDNNAIVYFVRDANVDKYILTATGTMNMNPQAVAVNGGFYLAWATSSDEFGTDIMVRKLENNGTLLNAASVFGANAMHPITPTMTYQLVGGNDGRAAILMRAHNFNVHGDAIYGFMIQNGAGNVTLSAPILLVAPEENYLLTVTGGTLVGNNVTVEYLQIAAPEDPLEDVIPLFFRNTETFANDFIGGPIFSAYDIRAFEDVAVSFGIANIGIDHITSVEILVDGVAIDTGNANVAPGAVNLFDTVIRTGETLRNIPYSITVVFANGQSRTFSDMLMFANPDISIGQATTLVAQDGVRVFALQLYNDSDVPLAGNGNEVRLEFFADPMYEVPIPELIAPMVIRLNGDLALLDEYGLNVQFRYEIPQHVLHDGEIPLMGHRIYALASVWNSGNFVPERHYQANTAAIAFFSLTRFGEDPVVVLADTQNTGARTNATLQVQNNSMQTVYADSGIIRASLLDSEGNTIEVRTVTMGSDITRESSISQDVTFLREGTRVIAELLFGQTADDFPPNEETLPGNQQPPMPDNGAPPNGAPPPEDDVPPSGQQPPTGQPVPPPDGGVEAATTAQAPPPVPEAEPGSAWHTASEVFDDVPLGAWFYDYVTKVFNLNLFQGTAYRIFNPQANMTRAMFAQVLANLENADLTAYAESSASFGDVAQGRWYFPAVQWAANAGLVQGIGGGNFAPVGYITREQMAVMLHRFARARDIALPQEDADPFMDYVYKSYWAVEAVDAKSAAGIIRGRPDGRFDPQGLATRAEVAAIFARFLEFVD